MKEVSLTRGFTFRECECEFAEAVSVTVSVLRSMCESSNVSGNLPGPAAYVLGSRGPCSIVVTADPRPLHLPTTPDADAPRPSSSRELLAPGDFPSPSCRRCALIWCPEIGLQVHYFRGLGPCVRRRTPSVHPVASRCGIRILIYTRTRSIETRHLQARRASSHGQRPEHEHSEHPLSHQ